MGTSLDRPKRASRALARRRGHGINQGRFRELGEGQKKRRRGASIEERAPTTGVRGVARRLRREEENTTHAMARAGSSRSAVAAATPHPQPPAPAPLALEAPPREDDAPPLPVLLALLVAGLPPSTLPLQVPARGPRVARVIDQSAGHTSAAPVPAMQASGPQSCATLMKGSKVAP
jgi:hypothetical protein